MRYWKATQIFSDHPDFDSLRPPSVNLGCLEQMVSAGGGCGRASRHGPDGWVLLPYSFPIKNTIYKHIDPKQTLVRKKFVSCADMIRMLLYSSLHTSWPLFSDHPGFGGC